MEVELILNGKSFNSKVKIKIEFIDRGKLHRGEIGPILTSLVGEIKKIDLSKIPWETFEFNGGKD